MFGGWGWWNGFLPLWDIINQRRWRRGFDSETGRFGRMMMGKMGLVFCVAAVGALALVVGGCGGDGGRGAGTPTMAEIEAPTATPESTPLPSPNPTRMVTATPTPEPTLRPPQPIPQVQSATVNPIAFVSPSIDQQILDADVIVVASFVSAIAGVQTIPGGSEAAATYRPMQTLKFSATEYLKGTGPDEFVVEVLDTSRGVYTRGDLYKGYLTEAEAMAASTALLAKRNTKWDDRLGAIFLEGPVAAATSYSDSGDSGQSNSKSYGFTLSNQGTQTNFEYAVDTLSRTWLPAKEAPASESNTARDKTEFITDGSKNPPPVLSLAELKTRISEIATMLKQGEGVEGYERCVYLKLVTERHFRALPESRVWSTAFTVGSGLAAESVHLKKESGDPFPDALNYDDVYIEFWYSGPDSEHFKAIIQDDDKVASNGYSYKYTTARPLPKGKYDVNFHIWSAREALCSSKPTNESEDSGYLNYKITVTAPAGTVHEAFFDPTAEGTGDVSPASFTVNGTATKITGLRWSDGKVRLSLEPYVSLVGYALDFIGLDGSVSLTLGVSEADVDVEGGTLSWGVSERPWEEGDMLMLRIRED